MQVSQSTRLFGTDRAKVGALPAKPAYGSKRQPTPKGSFSAGGSSRSLFQGDKAKSTLIPTNTTAPPKKASNNHLSIGTASDLKRTASDVGKSNS